MNARHPSEDESVGLLALIDFKWLMTAEGLAVNVDRLRQDAAYAQTVFDAADASGNAVLRRIARELRERLGMGPVATEPVRHDQQRLLLPFRRECSKAFQQLGPVQVMNFPPARLLQPDDKGIRPDGSNVPFKAGYLLRQRCHQGAVKLGYRGQQGQ